MSIPEGWKLVPVEPTPEMLHDASEVDLAEETPEAYQEYLRAIHRRLVAAAPTPPAQDTCPKCGDSLHPNYGCRDAYALRNGGTQDDEALELLRQAAHALDEAADSIADWASYASDYFREKHDYEGDLKRTRDAAAHFRALIAKRGAA